MPDFPYGLLVAPPLVPLGVRFDDPAAPRAEPALFSDGSAALGS